MKKRLLVLVLLFALICAGCSNASLDHGTTEPAPSSTAAPLQTVPPTTLPPETTVPTTVPVDENIEFFTKLFDYRNYEQHPYGRNHYNSAMSCEFSRPEVLPLATFFFNSLTNYNVTEEERAFLGVSEFDHVHRLVPQEMNEVLEAYFDITLDDVDWDVVNIFYWDKTGCYYTVSGGALACEFVIHAVEELENGIFKIEYYNNILDGDYVITLQSRESEGGEGYRILSNLPV